MIVIPEDVESVFSAFRSEPGEATLHIVTGYASVTTAMWLLHGGDVSKIGPVTDFEFTSNMPQLRLLVGMSATGSVTREDHFAFQQIERASYGRVQIRYVPSSHGLDIHSKAYVWSDSALRATRAWTGSANFTMQGLGISTRSQENHLHPVSSDVVLEYALSRWHSAISCVTDDVREQVPLDSSRFEAANSIDLISGKTTFEIEESQDFYLYSRRQKQSYGGGAGVNWGIRPNRASRDEAYLAIPNQVGESDFFPTKNSPFDVVCDDGEILMLRGASGSARSGKDLTTWPTNSSLGLYLRSRLEVPPGELIQIEDLLRYGRTYVTISRLQNGEYILDFSPETSKSDPVAESVAEG